ncbi:hypothetical protein C8R43DRAFT_1120400 [Mycena crocata]|nr:hypothetical protein C8R43DRAFT_1120400 [Mycena crocata]
MFRKPCSPPTRFCQVNTSLPVVPAPSLALLALLAKFTIKCSQLMRQLAASASIQFLVHVRSLFPSEEMLMVSTNPHVLLLAIMAPLSLLLIAQLLKPSNPNPPLPSALDAHIAALSYEELEVLVDLIGLSDIAPVAARLILRAMRVAQELLENTLADQDDQLDSMIRNFDLSSLDESPYPRTTFHSSRSPGTNLAASAGPSAPQAPATSVRSSTQREPLYLSANSRTQTSVTSRKWLDAAAISQGVPSRLVHAVVKSPSKKKPAPNVYVIFHGHTVEVATVWLHVQTLITGFARAYQCGFASVRAVEEALEYVQSKGWTSACDPTTAEPVLPLPSSYEPNPLNSGAHALWYVVSRGLHPGIYSLGLECHLNVAHVKGSLYESFTARAEAEQTFISQFKQKNLCTLYR